MIFSAKSAEGQEKMVGIQNPAKEVIKQDVSFTDIPKIMKVLYELKTLPPPVKSGDMDANSIILIETMDEFFSRVHPELLNNNVFQHISNFSIHKYNTDKFYKDSFDWVIGQLIARGWQFTWLKNPATWLWNSNIPKLKEEIKAEMKSHYEVMMAKGQTEKALDQFFERVLDSMDSRVVLWRD